MFVCLLEELNTLSSNGKEHLLDGPASTELCLPDKVPLQKKAARQKQNET